MKPKRALFIFTQSFPYEGGDPYLNDEYAVYTGEGIALTFIPKRKGMKKVDASLQCLDPVQATPGIKHRIKALGYYLKEFAAAPPALYFKRMRYNLAMLSTCIAKAEKLADLPNLNEHSILYTYWFDDMALTAAFLKKMHPEIKWVSRAHGYDVYEEQSDDHYLFFKKLKLSLLDRLYVVSENGAAHLRKQFPQFAAKVQVSYLGCHKMGINPRNTDPDTLHIASCAVIRDIKRLDRLFEILPHLKYKKVLWHVIGDGPDFEKMKTLYAAQAGGILECIFYGHVRRERIAEIYSENPIDVFISLSRTEGLPVSIMEAISAGIPVLATDAGGTREIVNEKTGQLLNLDFSNEELIRILDAWTSTDFVSEAFRKGCENAWDDHFNAEKNYRQFKEALLA